MIKTQTTQKEEKGLWDDAELISVYTRAQALEDGFLIDVSETAHEAGFRIPVAVTKAVWDGIVVPDDRARPYGQCEEGRLWDVLSIAVFTARRNRSRNHFLFDLSVIMKERQHRTVTLKSVVHAGDHDEPVVTIMTPDED